MHQWHFQKNPTVLEFDTIVERCIPLDNGTYGVVLRDTIFSPEGDRGTINDATVEEVYYEDRQIVHVVATHIARDTEVHLELNPVRRDHICAHTTARLLISQALWELNRIRTVNFTVEKEGAFVDIKAPELSSRFLEELCTRVHELIGQQRAVRVFKVPYSQAKDIYKRHHVFLEPTSGDVLLTEIRNVGVFPYRGMVLSNTSYLGCLVPERLEHLGDRFRLFFSTGVLGQRRVVERSVLLSTMAAELRTPEDALLPFVRQRNQEFSTISHEYTKSFKEFLRQEIAKVDLDAPVVINFYQDISASSLREFAEHAIQVYPSKVFIFFSQEQEQLHYICRGPQHSQYDMQQLSHFIARCIQGKGEGSANIAEGTGAVGVEVDELVHLCSTFLQNYRIHKPGRRIRPRTSLSHHEDTSHMLSSQ